MSEPAAAANVAIVIVSHSPLVARGAADMVRQMVGDEVKVAHAGGNAEGGLGTDVASIMAAIESVWSSKGVAVLVDLGGAETNSEMAIEMLGERGAAVVICNAPVVEGAVMAATEAAGGSSLAEVRATAEDFRS
jgi:dihydroxyacetone kinase phosphotransfer subunit